MLPVLVVVHLLAPVALVANLCPFAAPTCHVAQDVNCDGRDEAHCGTYDLDGSAYGDCTPDGQVDDFFLFYDGNFNGTADPCEIGDIVLVQPDAVADGTSSNPLCDRKFEEAPQADGIFFSDSTTLEIVTDGTFDVARGRIGEISVDGGGVNLGAMECLADDSPATGFLDVTEVPQPAEIFFYVVRWKNRVFSPSTLYPYGWADCQVRYVEPGNGDCVNP